MREEQAIVEVIPVSKQGEIKNFQVKVPMNASAVIGIETGMRTKRRVIEGVIIPPGPEDIEIEPIPLPFDAIPIDLPVRSSVVGELKLQSPEKPNVFYGTLVRDPFANENFCNPLLIPGFQERDWTHGYKKEMEKITIDARTTVISGFYRDLSAESLRRDTAYEIFLAVWFKIETAKK